MELSLVCHAPHWGASGWMSFLARRKTSGGSRFGLRSPTSAVRTMLYWVCQHSPSSCSNAHETYLKMKIPGPNGVITDIGDFRKSLECTSAGGNLADSQ